MAVSPTASFRNNMLSNGSETIDLTGDDDVYDYPQQLQRMRIGNTASRTPGLAPPSLPAMSSFTSNNQRPAMAMPTAMAPSMFVNQPLPPPVSQTTTPDLVAPYRPAYAAPKNISPRPPPPPPQQNNQVIDLTTAPSPPPQSRPDDLPPKTPVCIGQLSCTALVLYPVPHIVQTNPGAPPEYVAAKLQYENKVGGPSPHTVHIKTPEGEPFAVIEQKVADHIGHMLGKGLIRLEAKLRKGPQNLPMLPMYAVVFTPKGNVPVVGRYLQQCGLLLDHPSVPFNFQEILSSRTPYINPHNPPPGGHVRTQLVRNGPAGNLYPSAANRWHAPQVPVKSVEVQRSQVDELFKNLKTGEALRETEAAPEVATTLYPHQKKAVTFLLDRERELPAGTTFSSLWQKRYIGATQSWINTVTQKEVFTEPVESKGAILADDMGLGKTITCVSLLAATIRSADVFAQSGLDNLLQPPTAGPSRNDPHPSHFAGAAYGMPATGHLSDRQKAKAGRDQEKYESIQLRASRLKVKSRATLIICPLSTVSNWEDQFREHWSGEVSVVGGGANTVTNTRPRYGRPLRVYIYHGNARRPDPNFLADFDAVITTYATLASEFSKQNKSLACEEEDECSDDSGCNEVDMNGNTIIIPSAKVKKAGSKRKKCSAQSEASSALQSVHWFRVVLDEAHCIKETGTVGSRASCDLVADRRLCLTGTPVQNKLDDVFALVKFLRIAPLDDKNQWTEYIGAPVKFGQTLGVARLQTLMSTITLRRTKESKTEDGKRILTLPPRRDEMRLLRFDPHEQRIYDRFFDESKAEFTEMSNKNEVMKNYVGILQKILRLRQICDHYELVQGKVPGQETMSSEDMAQAIDKEGFNVPHAVGIWSILKEAATTQCVECGCELAFSSDAGSEEEDMPTAKKTKKAKTSAGSSKAPTRASSPSTPSPVMTRCQHLFCIMCFRNHVLPNWPHTPQDQLRSCSACQGALTAHDAIEIKPEYLATAAVGKGKKPAKRVKKQKGAVVGIDFQASTKVRALLGDLVVFSRSNPHSSNYDPSSVEVEMVDENGISMDDGVVKTVVFSQWTTMLDKIEDALEASGIKYDRLDGTMKRDDRIRAMDALKHDKSCEVLLVSLKAGGVGLNLTAAQRVYLMDPYWNPAVENQAVDRIHRLGQTRPVTTVKLIIENTIEARLLEVQKQKTELANMTLGQNFSKQELMARRLEELNQLFG